MIGRYVADRKLAEHIAECERAFPGYELLIEDLVAEGDRVVVRGEFRGIRSVPGLPAERQGCVRRFDHYLPDRSGKNRKPLDAVRPVYADGTTSREPT